LLFKQFFTDFLLSQDRKKIEICLVLLYVKLEIRYLEIYFLKSFFSIKNKPFWQYHYEAKTTNRGEKITPQ